MDGKKYEGIDTIKHEVNKGWLKIKKPLIVRRFYIIIEKNIKRLLSSKISAALILFGPLVLIFMLGLAFQGSGFFGVKLGVYSTQYNNVSENVIKAMQKSDFTIVREPDANTCIEDVKSAKTHLCIQFPVDFKSGKLAFFVDYSRLNLVYAIVSKINDEIDELSNQISLDVTQDLLDVISNSSDQLNSSSQLIQNLRANSEELRESLYVMGLNISSLDVGESQDMINSLTNDSSTINQNIKSTRNDLSSLQATLKLIQSQSSSTINKLKERKSNVEQTQISQGCEGISARDLTNFLSGNNFFTELQKEPNPICSLLKTFETNLELEIANVEEAAKGVDEMIIYVDSMDSGISNMETQVRVEAEGAKAKINELNIAKSEMSKELFQLAEVTGNSSQVFVDMSEKLDFIVTEFDKIAMTDAKTVIKPIRTLIKPLNSKKINTLDIIFPSILVMIMMFVGILIGTSL